jgi:Ca2+-binding RTX toxin-like protein
VLSPRKSALASTVSLAMCAALALAAAPSAQAAAQDAPSAAVTGMFGRLATDFLPQVASSAAVSRQLPTVAVTPAESVGLRTAFADALGTGGPLENLADQATLTAMASYVDGADANGWAFTASTPNDHSLTVGFTRTVTADAGLDIRDQNGAISLSTGTGIDVTGTLSGSFTFVYDATALQAVLTQPSMSIATVADLPAGKQLNAGLGILGVRVVGAAGTADYSLQSNVTTSWANPDNDAAGSLAFDNPGTSTADDGELSADGAATGLVTATRSGTLAGHLVAEPRANDQVANLPQVGATIDLSSALPATFDAPSITSVVPTAAQPFLTLTPRDLAAALSQAASAVLGMQNARDGNLPLMRGSIANAVDAVGGIKEFLADQVPDADPDDQTPGQPKFASLQDMLAALNTAEYADSGWKIDVLGDPALATDKDAARYDPTSKKVSFTLRATRGVAAPIELNLLGAATSGTATYSATGLSVTGSSATLPTGTALAGRKVTSGASYGTVATVPTATTLTLTGDGWVGGRPANGSAFAVEAADPKTGAPEFADVLKTTTGIGTANAEVSTATVTPDVVLTLPMALDLSAPLTYAADLTKLDCNPDAAVESPCPFQQVDASGLARVITSLPLAADRVLLRQSARDVLVADAEISSPVQITTSSGFLGLSIDGDLELTQAAGEHLQTLALTKGTAEVPVFIPVPAFVEQVRLQAVRTTESTDDVFSQKLEGAVEATIDVSVDDSEDALDGKQSTELTLNGTVDALADGIQGTDVSVVATTPAEADLLKALNFEPENPTSLFGGVREAFKSAGSDLTTMNGGGLDVPIPFVGSSVSQLIGAGASGADGVKYAQVAGTAAVPATDTTPAVDAVPATTRLTDAKQTFTRAFIGRQIVVGSTTATIVDQGDHTLTLAPQLGTAPVDDTPYLVENELLGAVHLLTASTPATLQDALAIAQASLGNSSTIDFGLVDNGGAKLRLDLTWERKYAVSQPVSLDLGDQELGGASAGGELSLTASGTVKLRLLLPLTKAAMLDPIENTLVDETESAIDFGVKVDAGAAHIGASIGPVSLDLGTVAEPGSFKAGIGLKITGTTGEDTPSIADFFTTGFGVTVTNGGSCTTGVVICGKFPVFVSGVKPPGDDLTITSTLAAGESLTKVFSTTNTKVELPSGLQKILDGEGFKFDSLAEGLQQYLFYSETALRTASNDGEMPVVGKDLQAGADFMGKAREKLDAMLAVADPTTVGGATTMLKAKLSEMGVVVDGSAGIDVNFTCTSVLTPPSEVPTAVSSPTPAAAADTTPYVYKVVSTYKDAKLVTHDSIPSAESAPVLNAATISSSKFNKVSWKKVDLATGYKVLRAIKPTTGEPEFGVVGTIVGNSTLTYDDKTVTPDPAKYTAETKAYSRIAGVSSTCAPETSVLQIEGLVVDLQLGQGKVGANGCDDDLNADGTVGKLGRCIGGELPVDLGIPGLSLQAGDGGSVKGSVGWNLDLSIGLSRARGFYVNTNKVPGQPEFRVGASLGLTEVTGPELKAQLAIIDVDVETNSSKREFVGQFGIDINDDPNDGATNFDLTVAEMKRLRIKDVIVVTVRAQVDINWHLAARASAALPGISTDFRLTWEWGLKSGPPPPPTNKKDLSIAFNAVTLNTGEFFGQALNPYLQQIADATKPLQPIIDTIFTPVPVISDLSKAAGGSEITIATLAEKFNTLPEGAKIQPFLKAIKLVKQLLTVKCEGGLAPCGVLIGSFELNKDRAATTTASAGSAKSMIDTKPASEGGTYAPNKEATTQIEGKDASKQLSTPGTISKVKSLTAGLSIPVMEDPTILFELISGGDIPLVEFDSGPLSLGFQFQKSFGPIYAPPPVMMVVGGGASVTLRIAAGFDTYGIRRAIETGDGAQVLDSLYFKTVDNNGVPIPVVQFTGYLEAGASVSIGILEVGVVGGIKLTVGFYWNDPNGDGKFRLFEFGAAVANNPICLFNVGGELSLYIKVFVVIGFSPFSVSFDFTLVNIKLLDFSFKPNCTPPPPRLGGTHDGVLYVFAGKFGGAGPRGNAAWDADNKAETWAIRQVPEFTDEQGDTHEAAVEVRGIGLTESFSDKDDAIRTVVIDGRTYTGNLTISFTGGSGTTAAAKRGAFTKTAVVFTGSGDDVIRTGEGHSWVDSGAGADNITTLDRADLDLPLGAATARVAGGPGPDVITVGNGNDTVTGDGSITVTDATRTVELAPDNDSDPHNTSLVGALDVGSLKDSAMTNVDTATVDTTGGTDGNDQIAAGLGAVHLSGNGGVDTIGTANDSPLADSDGVKAGSSGGSADTEALYRAHDSVLVGGAGGDILKSGSANDKVFTGSHAVIDEFGDGSGDDGVDDANGIDRNTVDTGAGSDTVYGSNALDFVTTHSTPAQKAIVFGGAGADVLTGGLGSDEIYGGPDDDYVVAAPATVGEPASAQDALGSARLVGVLPGAGSSPKKLVGGTGSDRIYGSDGASMIFGDTTVDACDEQSDPVSKQPTETTNAADAADLVLGGNGVDVVNAGGGNDWVYAAGSSDRVCGNSGSDHLYAGDAADLVYGGTGGDEAYGDDGDDQVYGNDGADAVYGATGADRLQGNGGDDLLFGGADADVLLGGTSKAGAADGADTIFGDSGSDVAVGDNAQTDVAGSAPYPTDLGSTDATMGANDQLIGGDDADRAYGGLANDTISGGNGDDHAEGNPGRDAISGDADDDDLVGGSSELATGSETGRPDLDDGIDGGIGQDVITGDNAVVTRGGSPHPQTTGRGITTTRGINLADETNLAADGRFGGDRITGGGGTDIVFGQRGNDDVSLGDGADYGEGGPDVDVVNGGTGDDDVVGGSFTALSGAAAATVGQPDGGDTLAGDAGEDVVLGDNGAVARPVSPATGSPLTLNRVEAQRAVTPYDLGDTPASGSSGADTILGAGGNDVLLGQGGADWADGGSEADYVEGGQASDLVLGGTEDDDVVGGSSAGSATVPTGQVGQPDGPDNVSGGAGSDLILGDNGLLTRPTGGLRDWRTDRADSTQADRVPGRGVTMHDLAAPAPSSTPHFGADAISGQDGVDVIFGQDGADAISGGSHDDYVEGQGGADGIHGDVALSAAEIVSAPAGSAWVTPAVDDSTVTPGQDDIAGGWAREGYRDGDDVVHGDGNDDFVVADNGSIARVVDGTTESVYAARYGTLRDGSAKVRVAGGGAASTRFCPTTGATATSTCEVAGAFGSDTVFGDAGQDVLYGQDGADTIRGGDGDDDVYGELGADFLYGEGGEDAILGDRGGIQDRYEAGTRSTTTSLTMPPAVSFTSRLNGSVSREVDLLHDVNGTDFVGEATSPAMPLDGITFGGVDRIRGGDGHDSIHAGAGDDLVNGDSGGDSVFGDRGDDVMWGGTGRTCNYTQAACLADKGSAGEYIDHLVGGKGADVVDWRPRGAYGTGTALTGRTCSTSTTPVTTKKDGTTDPCSWFEMTERADDGLATTAALQNNQHHQGVDWVYGGWDRDVMQGDTADNGPNPGDRLIDWNGVYNLWSHCNSAYGGFNDIRVPAPDVQDFLLKWATGNGAGRPATGGLRADVATPGTSAYDELGLVYNADASAHGIGSAYPTTPGHFDDANACAGY